MIKKRYILTGMVEVGDWIRLVLYPDDPVKKKKTFDLSAIMEGDMGGLQQDALIQSMISGNPPTLYMLKKEFDSSGFKLDDHININLEVE
jgi:hypothetical protein